jgi:hypothetical protein
LKKGILVLFIALHLIVILLLPNVNSYVARHNFPSFLLAYANQIGFNTTWNFFSPEPAHTMYYEYQVFFKDEALDPVVGYIPPQKDQVVTQSSDRRMLYAMRYFFLDPRRVERVLIPFLCSKFPDAERISIRHYVLQLPSLDQATLEKHKPIRDLKVLNSSLSEDYRCEAHKNEEGVL